MAVASPIDDVPLLIRATAATPGVALGGAWSDALHCRGLALVRDVGRGFVDVYAPVEVCEGDLLLRGVLAPPVELLYRGPDHVRFDFLSSGSVRVPTRSPRGRSKIARKAAKAGGEDDDEGRASPGHYGPAS